MPERPYHDPQIAAAVGGLAKAFAPPSGVDAYGWARAAAERAESQRLADLWAAAQNPGSNQQQFDRMGQAVGRWTPSSGYYGVNTAAETSRMNNAADNARAIQQTRIQQDGELQRSFLAPVGAGATRFVPPQLAERFGVPGTQTGVVSLNPGEQATLPDGRVLAGAPKPKTESEVSGEILAGLPPALRQAKVLGGVNTTETIGADGQPRVEFNSEAAIRGAQPVQQRQGEAASIKNYVSPDGAKRGTAAPGPDGKLRDTQTGEEIPPGSTFFSGVAQGAPSEFGPKTTEREGVYAYGGTMSQQAVQDLNAAFADPSKMPSAQDYMLFNAQQGAPGMAGATKMLTQNMMSPAGQLFYQNLQTALPYQLMVQSGQAVTEQEYQRKLSELMPVPGEDPAVTQNRIRNFNTYLQAVQGLAGAAWDKAQGAVPGAAPGAPRAPSGPVKLVRDPKTNRLVRPQ